MKLHVNYEQARVSACLPGINTDGSKYIMVQAGKDRYELTFQERDFEVLRKWVSPIWSASLQNPPEEKEDNA